MRYTKIQLILSLAACALLITALQAQGSSSIGGSTATPMPVVQEPQTPPSQAQPDQAQPNPDSSKSSTFTGTIVKDGEQYVLRDSSGGVYKLDDSSRAQAFEGKTVKVTGRLDADSKIIHVDTIQALVS